MYFLFPGIQDLFHNSQPHTCTLKAVALHQGLKNNKDLLMISPGNSGTIVGYKKLIMGRVFTVRDVNTALRFVIVFDRIADEIGKHLEQWNAFRYDLRHICFRYLDM